MFHAVRVNVFLLALAHCSLVGTVFAQAPDKETAKQKAESRRRIDSARKAFLDTVKTCQACAGEGKVNTSSMCSACAAGGRIPAANTRAGRRRAFDAFIAYGRSVDSAPGDGFLAKRLADDGAMAVAALHEAIKIEEVELPNAQKVGDPVAVVGRVESFQISADGTKRAEFFSQGRWWRCSMSPDSKWRVGEYHSFIGIVEKAGNNDAVVRSHGSR